MERDNIKDEVPNESLGEVTRLLGQKWKALPKEEKQVRMCQLKNHKNANNTLEILRHL